MYPNNRSNPFIANTHPLNPKPIQQLLGHSPASQQPIPRSNITGCSPQPLHLRSSSPATQHLQFTSALASAPLCFIRTSTNNPRVRPSATEPPPQRPAAPPPAATSAADTRRRQPSPDIDSGKRYLHEYRSNLFLLPRPFKCMHSIYLSRFPLAGIIFFSGNGITGRNDHSPRQTASVPLGLFQATSRLRATRSSSARTPPWPPALPSAGVTTVATHRR